MGTGMGINCERCGTQISYDMTGYELKEGGFNKYDLCDTCANIVKFDQKLKEDTGMSHSICPMMF